MLLSTQLAVLVNILYSVDINHAFVSKATALKAFRNKLPDASGHIYIHVVEANLALINAGMIDVMAKIQTDR